MKEYNENNASEMLNLLVDGELDNTKESVLYSMLASNDDLRIEMRELLDIRESVHKDTEAFTPPIEATQAVFKNLGFSSPIPATKAPISSWFSILKKVSIPVSAAFVASLLTFWFFNSNFIEQNNSIERNIPAVSSISNSNSIPNKNICSNVINNNLSHSTNKSIVHNYKKNHSNFNTLNNLTNKSINNQKENDLDNSNNSIIIDDDAEENNNGNNNTNSNNNFIAFIDTDSFNKLISNSYSIDVFNNNKSYKTIKFSNSGTNSSYIPLLASISEIITPNGENKYSVQFRILSSNSYPSPQNLPSGTNSLFSNMSIAGYYKLDDNFRFGIEFGQEHFGQEYYNYENNQLVFVEQNPNIFWAGITARYETSKLENLFGIQFFGQPILSYTNLGPLAKGFVGVQYYSGPIGISFGLEGSWLMYYNNQKELYSTKKLGISIGTSFCF